MENSSNSTVIFDQIKWSLGEHKRLLSKNLNKNHTDPKLLNGVKLKQI